MQKIKYIQVYLNTSNVINKHTLRIFGFIFFIYLNTSNVINKPSIKLGMTLNSLDLNTSNVINKRLFSV